MDDTQISAEVAESPAKRLLARAKAVARREVLAAAGLVVSLLLLLGALLASAPKDDEGSAQAVNVIMPGPLFHQVLPEVMAVLETPGTRSRQVLLAAVVELPEEAVAPLKLQEVEIVAEMQAYLRGLGPRDLAGSEGMERLRIAAIAIVNRHIAPSRARNVLFTRLLY